MPQPSPLRELTAEPLHLLVEAAEIVSGHTLDLDSLLEKLVALVRKVVDSELIAIMLKTDGDALRVRFAHGFDDGVADDLRIKLGKGITGAAAKALETIVVNDVNVDPRYIAAVPSVRSELAVPLIARGDLVGVIDLQSTQIDAFGEQEQSILELIASRFSIAIEAARLYRATARQNRDLKALTKIAQEFTHILQLDELLKKIASQLRPVIPYDALSILLLEEGGAVLQHYFGVRYDQHIQWDNIELGVGIVGTAAQTKQPILVIDTKLDDRYVAVIEGIRSEVAVPLMCKDKVIGVIDLECEQVGAFTARHVQTLLLLAPQIATAIENARLYEEVARNKARMEQDLTAARALQQNLLYAATPQFPGVEIAAHNEAAHEVAGDLYDFFPAPGLDLGILIGDVSGKGAAAALYGALANGLLRNLVQPDQSPAIVLKTINRVLMERKIDARYLTALYAQWRPAERSLVIANAGQPRPILRRSGKVTVLEAVGIPLGLLEGTVYEDLSIRLEPDDLLVTFSDGITETTSPTGADYDEKRLIRTIESHPKASAQELIDAIFNDVNAFSGGFNPADDRTAIVVKISNSGDSWNR